MSEQKRNVPVSDLDLQMQMIEPAYGKGGISLELAQKLQQYGVRVDENGKDLLDEEGNAIKEKTGSLWGLLG